MPTYVYEPLNPGACCDFCRQGFETKQGIKEEPLKTCPKCDNPVKRIITGINVITTMSEKSILSDRNIKKHGFTKLVNEGGGKFRKI